MKVALYFWFTLILFFLCPSSSYVRLFHLCICFMSSYVFFLSSSSHFILESDFLTRSSHFVSFSRLNIDHKVWLPVHRSITFNHVGRRLSSRSNDAAATFACFRVNLIITCKTSLHLLLGGGCWDSNWWLDSGAIFVGHILQDQACADLNSTGWWALFLFLSTH